MSTAPAPAPVATGPREPEQVTVISHSTLFYWWPVWAVGFLMGILSYFGGARLATVPQGTQAYKEVIISTKEGPEKREALVLPKGAHVRRQNPDDLESQTVDPKLRMSDRKGLGVVFCITLLLVIVITNVPLRGMWSLIVIITVVMLSIIFHLAGWWEKIINAIDLLDIRINAGAYFFIATSLFIIWLLIVMVFDRQVYMVFTPGQFKVCTEIGGGEKVYDTIGLTLERQRSDLFRHLILGLGSGDLIVKTTGAQAHHFDLPNVLFIGKKVQQIEDLLRKQKVLETKG